jgi:hypothetical protein
MSSNGKAQYCRGGKLGFDTKVFLTEYAVVGPQFAAAIPNLLSLKWCNN